MSVACSTYGGEERHIQGLVGKPVGKRPLGRPRLRLQDNYVFVLLYVFLLLYLYIMIVKYVMFFVLCFTALCVLFVHKFVLCYCQWVSIQLQLTNILCLWFRASYYILWITNRCSYMQSILCLWFRASYYILWITNRCSYMQSILFHC